MANYDQLPVYRESYELFLSAFEIVRKFPREYKYTFGDRIKDEIVSMVTSVYRANVRTEKGPEIRKARESIETLRLYFRLCRDLKIIPIEHFVSTNLFIESISKQLTAWERYFSNLSNTP